MTRTRTRYYSCYGRTVEFGENLLPGSEYACDFMTFESCKQTSSVEAVTDVLVCRVGVAYIGAKLKEFIGCWIISRRCSICQTRLCAAPDVGIFANDELVIVQKEEARVLTHYRSASLLKLREAPRLSCVYIKCQTQVTQNVRQEC